MVKSHDQLPLELPVASAGSRDDFLVGKANALAFNLIDRWPDWPGRVVVLVGPPGSGKSHLADVWAERAGARKMAMCGLNQLNAPQEANFLIEDARAGSIDEQALFHLLNFLRAHRLDCLITSREPPSDWQLQLPDLRSRIMAAQRADLDVPDDDLLSQVIVKHFADRQLVPAPGVVAYLVARMERSLQTAALLVERIDRLALARRGPISRKLASDALNSLAEG